MFDKKVNWCDYQETLQFDPLQAWVRGRQGPVKEHRDEVTYA